MRSMTTHECSDSEKRRMFSHLVNMLETLDVTLDVMENTEESTPPLFGSLTSPPDVEGAEEGRNMGGVLGPAAPKDPPPPPLPPLSLLKLSIHERGLDRRFST